MSTGMTLAEQDRIIRKSHLINKTKYQIQVVMGTELTILMPGGRMMFLGLDAHEIEITAVTVKTEHDCKPPDMRNVVVNGSKVLYTCPECSSKWHWRWNESPDPQLTRRHWERA